MRRATGKAPCTRLGALTPARRDSVIHVIFSDGLQLLLAQRRIQWVPASRPAWDYAELQDSEATLQWLDSMFAERSTALHVVPFDPVFDFLRGDPRFQGFIARLPWHPRLDLAGLPPVRR